MDISIGNRVFLGRMVSFDQTPPLECLEKKLQGALKMRTSWFDKNQTNAFRLVNAEGDGIPGLVIDLFAEVAVLQSSTKGIDRIKSWIAEWLVRHLKVEAVYEKSLIPSRREEGLEECQGFLRGEIKDEISFKENGLNFSASLAKSQKTGFFLDTREMRQWVREIAKDKRVLNAFSYTGGFTVYALAGNARSVDSVDISKEAIDAAKVHTRLNGFDPSLQKFYCEDAFDFLRQRELAYDLVILDPPAFAKKKKDIVSACRGYKEINRLAMQKMPPQSLLLTFSCSYHVDEELFQKVLFQAALEAGRQVRMIGRHRLAIDHPINLYHPESDYLKSFLLFIE